MKLFHYELEINGDMGTNMGRGYFKVKGIVAARNIMCAMNKLNEYYADNDDAIVVANLNEEDDTPYEISCEEL